MRCIFFLFFLLPLFVHSQQTSASKLSVLKNILPSLMKQANVPGLSIVVIKNGEVSWTQSFGYANVKTKVPLTSKHVFEASSLGVPLFSYAVLRMAELGRIDLDRPIAEYYPVKYAADTQKLKKITARNCLTHTSGLPNTETQGGNLRFYHQPGEKFSYSAEGIKYLQKAVEYKEGKSLNEIMNELVFLPLKMTSTSYVWQNDYESLKVYPHDYLGLTTERIRPAEADAGRSIHTTSSDYAKFLRSLLNKDLLQTAYYKQMMDPLVPVEEDCSECPEKGRRKLSKEISWGMGIGLQQAGDKKYFWHWGDNGNNQGFMLGEESSKDGILLLANSANLLSVVEKITATCFDDTPIAMTWLKVVPYNRAERLVLNGILTNNKVDRSAVSNLTYNQLNWVAFTLLKVQRTKEAIEVLKTRIDSSAISDSYYGMALAYMMSDNFESAKEYSKKSIVLNTNNSLARELLQNMEDETRLVSAAILKQYAGKYNTPFGPAVLSISGGRMFFKLADYPAEKLVARDDTTFIARGYGIELNFEKDIEEKASRFVMIVEGEKKEATRQ
jgi:CubicO group peptidase (beta-lactamase class C family)